MKRILFLAIAVLFLTSCVTQRKCTLKFPPTVTRDSIYIETIKEIPIPIPGDTIRVEAPINCPDQDIVSMENSKLKQQIRILNGKLISNTLIKPDTIKVFVPKIEIRVKEVKVPQPVKFIPKLYLIAFYLWIGVFLAIAGYVGFRVFIKK